MALSLDLLNLICTIPQADMIDVTGGAPSEIRELNINAFRKEWGALMDDEPNVDTVWPFEWTPPKTSGGIDYAPFFEIINGWTVLFSDSLYNVNVVGGNSNMSDVIIKNQVGVNTANSAGLQDSASLQAASYDGSVALDPNSAFSGTLFPVGTRANPVNNLEDAKAICVKRGIHRIQIVRSMTFATSDMSDGYEFFGDSVIAVNVVLDASVDVNNCVFQNLTISGVTDGSNVFRECNISDVTFADGALHQCSLTGTITMSGGADAQIYDSWSGLNGVASGVVPKIDLGGSGHSLLMRNYSGAIRLTNATGPQEHTLDMASGNVIVDPDVTNGRFYVRGVSSVEDNSTGLAEVVDQTAVTQLDRSMWASAIVF